MLRFIKKKAINKSSDVVDKSQCEVDQGQQSKRLKRNNYLDSKLEHFSPGPLSNGKSFSCENLLLTGSFSQSKRQQHSTSVHTMSSTSDDQLFHTLPGSLEDDENDDDIYSLPDIQYKDGNSAVHNHIRKPVLHAKV